VLTPSARQLWRDPETLQVGRRSGRSAVLAGLDRALRSTLGLLDGTRDRTQVLHAAAASGCSPARASALLDLLEEGGLLEDAGRGAAALGELTLAERERLAADIASLALVRGDGGWPAVAHRQQAGVLVVGAGRVGAPLALALATAGLSAVDVVDEGLTRPEDTGAGGLSLDDVGRSRGEAARERLRLVAPSTQRAPLPRPDLVVLAPARPEHLQDGRRLVPEGAPHLLVEVRDTTGVVGPLVLPGRTPCLRCLDLTRTDLDPAWPALAGQLASPTRGREACDGALALAVAAQAALQVLALLDGTNDPATLGGTLELALPDWRWRRRSWPLHPDCGCASAPGPTRAR